MTMIARSVASTHWFQSSTMAASRPRNGTTTPIMFAVRSALDIAMQAGGQPPRFLEVSPGPQESILVASLQRLSSLAVLAVRYILPLVLFLGGFVLLAVEPNSTGLEGWAMATGAALSVLFLNWLFRAGVRGDRERDDEEAARDYYGRHGRWPDE